MGKEAEVIPQGKQSVLVDLMLSFIIKVGKYSPVFPQ